jgi:hypothetical protein
VLAYIIAQMYAWRWIVAIFQRSGCQSASIGFWFYTDASFFFYDFFLAADYQGLTRSFCHGTIYCSSITAKLVNMKIGIPWDRLQILPLNQKINIAGIGVTCLDANHCPGSIIILFEPANGKVWPELTSSYTIL